MLTIILNFVIDYKKHIQILAVIAQTIQVNNDYKKSKVLVCERRWIFNTMV